jgi:hypothetical protein
MATVSIFIPEQGDSGDGYWQQAFDSRVREWLQDTTAVIENFYDRLADGVDTGTIAGHLNREWIRAERSRKTLTAFMQDHMRELSAGSPEDS